ncbi:Uncharacterised protein [Mycobacteroides abscessus subsp. massiliense]|nr:Uncharacterised protein [Mycobacteroides abscessus subsp. massiliense]
MTMPDGGTGLTPGAGWLHPFTVQKGMSQFEGRTRPYVDEYYKTQIQGSDPWKTAADTFFQNILKGFGDLQNFLTLVVKAATGAPGGLVELTAFFAARWNDLADAFEQAIESIVGLKWLRDILTGITGATDSQVQNWVTQLLTAASNLDAGKVIGLLAAAVIPGLDASKITSGQFAQSMVAGLQAWFDGIAGKAGAVVGDVVARLQHLATNGLFDATKLFGTLLASFIPGLDASKIVSGQFGQAQVIGLPGIASDLVDGFKNIYDQWFGGTSATGTPAEVAQTIASIQQAVIGGYTVDVFTTNGTWNKPANLIEWWGICIGGGGRGTAGGASQTNADVVPGGLGGSSGGYIAQQVDPADVPASVSVTVGPGANANGADGGITSIGALVASSPNASGISMIAGFTPAASTPGRGGVGGQATGSGGSRGSDGGATPLAAAGVGGNGINSTGTAQAGTAGGTAPLDGPTKAGGGGGGGGGGAGSTSSSGTRAGGNGGAGGYPGGGSGGGGSAVGGGTFATQTPGQAGPAPHGAAIIIWK